MFSAPVSFRGLAASARSPLSVPALSTVFRRAVLSVGCLAAFLAPSFSHAQTPGELDTSFNSIISNADLYALTLEKLNGATVIFVAGDSDGEALLDTLGENVPASTFGFADFGNLSRIIYVSVPEKVPNGSNPPKLLVGGLFGKGATQIVNNQTAQNIARLNTDGSLDPAFNPQAGADGYVTAILPLSAAFDGGIVVGGLFSQFNRIDHAHIVRLDNAGNIVPDAVFNSKLNFDDAILSLAEQQNPDLNGPQGQILAAGLFSNVNGNPHTKLARINADGTVDESFHPTFNNQVRVVISQADGKILAGGDFDTVDGSSSKHLVRLNYDGSVDTTFAAQVTTQPPGIDAPTAVNAITPAVGGGYYVGGNFYQINGVVRNFMGLVRNDGSLDPFDPGKAITNAVQRIEVDQDANLVYVSETRSKTINGKFPPELIRLFGGALPTPKVNVTASIPASTGKFHSQFRFTRSAATLSQPLTLYVTLVNDVAGNTFKFLPQPPGAASIGGKRTYTVNFPVNVKVVTIDVKSTKNLHGSEGIGLALQLDPNNPGAYRIGKFPGATVTVAKD